MTETIGVIGAGRMGLPIIGHLAKKGFRTLATDIDPAKRAEVEARKASWSSTLEEIAKASTVILVCVGFDRELRELFCTIQPQRGALMAVLSTVNPKTVQ
jgi:3-hydroxyisobutyrate dehydrogenase